MRIKSIKVKGLHGIFTKKIKFFDNYTFIHGINGTGKTSIIKAMEAITTPDVEWLVNTNYEYIEIFVENFQKYSFKFTKFIERIEIRQRSGNEYTSEEVDLVRINALYKNRERSVHGLNPTVPESIRSLIFQEFSKSLIFRKIQEIPTPMFLGLNRTAFLEPEYDGEAFERRMRTSSRSEYAGEILDRSLYEAQKLIHRAARQVIQRKRAHESKLRSDITFLLFSSPSGSRDMRISIPTQKDVTKYRKIKNEISATLQKIGYDNERIDREINPFFASILSNARILSKYNSIKDAIDTSSGDVILNDVLAKWIDSIPIIRLMEKYFETIDQFNKRLIDIRSEITQFESIINGFFRDSGKTIEVVDSGDVLIKQGHKQFEVAKLSSGEKQMFILLSQLSFNPLLKKANVLVIDEPEISLHVRWQEIFVDGIMRANSSTQLILATHSPSIVLDRKENMVDLNVA